MNTLSRRRSAQSPSKLKPKTEGIANSFMPLMPPPLSYYGGKIQLLPNILPLIPKHKTYVEVFGGGGALLFAKQPVSDEVYNDKHGEVVNFFRVLRDRGDELVGRLILTPYSRTEYQWVRQDDSPVDDVERARRYFILTQQSFNHAYLNTWAAARRKGFGLSFFNRVERLRETVKRLRPVMIEDKDFEVVIRKYDSIDTFFYIDPPYVKSLRTSPKKYACEMPDSDHERLLLLLQNVRGKVIISGYGCCMYADYLRQWDRIEVERHCNSTNSYGGKRKARRTELLWKNFGL